MTTTWLEGRRAEARAVYERTPLPTLKDENWRFTPLRGIDFASFRAPAPADAATTPVSLTDARVAGRLVQRGQTLVTCELDPAVAAQGVKLLGLEEAAATHAELVDRYLGSIVPLSDRFAAENAAAWSGGALIHVPQGVEVALPLSLAVEVPEEGARTLWRVLLVAEPGSKVTLLEELAPGAPGYLNAVVELSVGAGAHVTYVQAQDLNRETVHFSAHRAEIERDASLDWTAIALGGRLGKSKMESKLCGEGASVRVTGLYALDDRQHLDLDTTQEHAAPHTTSDLAFKGALLDRARAVWRGIIIVDEGAQRTDAFQENRNLLLSSKAHADSIPGLQIAANDVRCTHAATIGQVDRELIFFLMARGLSRAEAERLIVRGFFAETLERVPDEALRERFAAALEARIA